ncbi:MAG: hypothetical protein JSW66_12970 [Phycisphaerales bacterium]|nr:MAG: hypothetical protein JSW66_12970 [Phycisphaerales bacterium]
MSKISQFPPLLLARAAGLELRGRIHFAKDSIGDVEHGKDEDFEVFRKIILEPSKDQPEKPRALLIVRFRFARFAARTNRLLSLIPIPFIVAQQGFRSKTWMTGQKTGAFQGLYEWDSIEDAQKYWTSFPMKLMKKRAVPGTLNHEITAV